MNKKGGVPRYAVRLVVVFMIGGIVFFGGLSLFVPEGSRLTGSYDAKSLLYIAAAPVAYGGSQSCGAANCHSALFEQWSKGAHGMNKEQSKCEVCHGPLGKHPQDRIKLPTVRGDGNIAELCLTCHRKMKARSTTGQPQINPQEHPYSHEGVLKCTQCHNPHSPAIGAPRHSAKITTNTDGVKSETPMDKASGTDDSVTANAQKCFSCHGVKGRGGFAPVLASQSYEVLEDKLKKFRSGEVKGTMMNNVASQLKDDEINMLAHYFASLP